MLPRLLRYLTTIELVVLAVAGGGLFFVAGPMGRAWPWPLAPFTTRFLGAVYLAALVAVAMLLLADRWVPARTTLWALLGFTAVVFVISLFEIDHLEFDRPATWGWFPLYLILPVNAAYHLWRYRSEPMPPGVAMNPGWRWLLRGSAALLGFYSLGLLLLPETFVDFWPWPVDAFHARIYSAAFIAVAIGLYLVSRSGRQLEFLSVGLTHATLGAFAIVGLLIVDGNRDAVDWSAAGTWLWVGSFAALFALSLAMIVAARPALAELPLPEFDPDRNLAIARGFAAIFAGSFLLAGVAGFLPIFTTDPPTDAHQIDLDLAYGYLIGLYPVNALHSLLHLSFGIAAVAALAVRTNPLDTIGRYARVMAVILTVLTVMGLVPGLRTTFGLLPLFGHDVWLHALEAAAAAYVGFVVAVPTPGFGFAPQAADGG